MPRKTIDLSEKAFEIYKEIQRDDRSKYVSEAIIEKADIEQGNTLIQRIEELERKVKELEKKVKEWSEI